MSTDETAVYLIAHVSSEGLCVGPVKVGYTKHPDKRLASLQTGNPRHIARVFSFLTPTTDLARLAETSFHDLHRSERLAGEWFDLTPQMALNTLTKVLCACIVEDVTDPSDARLLLEWCGVPEAINLYVELMEASK